MRALCLAILSIMCALLYVLLLHDLSFEIYNVPKQKKKKQPVPVTSMSALYE